MSLPSAARTAPVAPGVLTEARRLTALALPIVVSLMAATLIGVVDTVMIAPLGTRALAGVSITGSVVLVFYSALYGLVSVTSVLAARAFGAGDAAGLARTARAGLVTGLVSGAAACALMLAAWSLLPLIGQPQDVLDVVFPYWVAMSVLLIPFAAFYAIKGVFEAVDHEWLGVGLAFGAVALNVPANWLLIHGVGSWQGFGLLGAGLGSLASQTASLLAALAFWRFAPSMRALRHPVTLRARHVLAQGREGLPLALGYAGEGGAFAAAGLMLGWFGASALAANQIVVSVASVLYMVPLGLAAAVSIRVGQAVGGEDAGRVRRIAFTALGVVVAWMLVVVTALLAFGGRIAEALAGTPEVAALAGTMFLVFAAMQVFDGVQATALGALRGLLDNTWPVVATLLCYYGIALPAAYAIGVTAGVGPNSVWIGYGSGLFLAAGLLVWRMARMTGRAGSGA